MSNEPEYYFNDVRVEDLIALMEASERQWIDAEHRVRQIYGVRAETASAIVYLRSRSRWTYEKELELVGRDRSGNPISLNTVLSGEF